MSVNRACRAPVEIGMLEQRSGCQSGWSRVGVLSARAAIGYDRVALE